MTPLLSTKMEKLTSDGTNFSTINSSVDQQHYFAGGYQPIKSTELKFLVQTILVLICVTGFAGNVFAAGVLIHIIRKGKPSLINSLILNLSTADLFILSFVVPFRAAIYSKPTWNAGWFICKTSDWFLHSCMVAKSLTTAVVAKACFMYASNPSKQVNIKYQTIFTIILPIWILAFVFPIPHWLFTTLKYKTDMVMCILNIPETGSLFLSVFVKLYPIFVFCIPLFFAFFYFWRAYGRCQRRGTKTQNLRNQIRSRRLTLMLLYITMAFTIMWLPEWISWLWMWHVHWTRYSLPAAFTAFSHIIMFCISLVDPIIFLVMNEEFRESCKGLCKRITWKKTHISTESRGTQVNMSLEGPPPESVQAEQQQANQEKELSTTHENSESPKSKKENPTFPDVEQFWHDREISSPSQDNDPTPWEHEGEEKQASQINVKL
ncbi:G-protein coupled receptor 151 [Protopterus annectens]|uniref:G-protein coupled receptor 151 n=1 Tax=Protopterus annectens TaxID=7888 RepID=UPI001CFA794A|nr:G-protein coupled receptor 151 [Protopterus annectens]